MCFSGSAARSRLLKIIQGQLILTELFPFKPQGFSTQCSHLLYKCASTTLQLLVRIINPAKETTIWHDVHKKFEHVAQLKMKLVADYEEKLPPVTDLECGHFHKRSKRWIESAHDLEAMYKLFAVNDE